MGNEIVCVYFSWQLQIKIYNIEKNILFTVYSIEKNILFTIKSIEKNILFDKIDEKEVLFLENKWRVGEINV